MSTYVLNLLINSCQLFRNYMFIVTHNKPLGLVLTTDSEVRRHTFLHLVMYFFPLQMVIRYNVFYVNFLVTTSF